MIQRSIDVRTAWTKRPKGVRVNYDLLGDPGALGENWDRLTDVEEADDAVDVKDGECVLSRNVFCVRDRALIAALRKPLSAETEALLAKQETRGAVLCVRVRALERGVCGFHAALCAPTTSMLEHAKANSRQLLAVHPTTLADIQGAGKGESGDELPTVLGRVTSERGFFHTQGQGGGIATISLRRYLEHRRKAEQIDPKLRNRMLMKNINTNCYREIVIEILDYY